MNDYQYAEMAEMWWDEITAFATKHELTCDYVLDEFVIDEVLVDKID